MSERNPERKTPNAPNTSPERSDRERSPNAERTERRARTHRTRGTQTLSLEGLLPFVSQCLALALASEAASLNVP